MMMYSLLFLSVCLIEFSHTNVIQAIKPINQTCLNFGHAHDCRFYSCFEERFPCGSTYWISNWGEKYCQRMKKYSSYFDKIGQEFLKKISYCLTNKLLQQRYYTLKQINCEQLRLAGQRIVHDCYMINAKLFCQAFHDKNRDCFMELIDSEDQYDLTIIKTLSSVGQKCTPKKRLLHMRITSQKNPCISSATL